MFKNTKAAKEASSILGKTLEWVPLEPNTITLASIVIAFFGFLAYDQTFQGSVMSLSLFLIAFAFDVVDGAVARAKGKVTKKRAFIDGITDRIVEFFLILVFFKMAPCLILQFTLLSILFFGTCMTSFVKAYAEHQGVLKHEKAVKLSGLLERAERSVLVLIAFILAIFGSLEYTTITIYLTATLSFVTFAQRFFTVFCKD